MSTTPFANSHLSYSRLSRFETCPLSFRLHYIEKRVAQPGFALQFGKAIHAVLEKMIREHMDAEAVGSVSEKRALELLRSEWAAAALSGVEAFQEATDIVKSFVRSEGVVDHRDVLAIEKEFLLPVGPFTVLGFIDRVNAIDDSSVEIVDYKTNRMLFTREEVDNSLQMSLYQLAAKRLWPWAKRFRLTFNMLRHDVRIHTERTDEQLETAKEYVQALGVATENATDFPPRLNSNCVYCDHKADCPAYADALKGKRTVFAKDPSDLEMVGREREEVARLIKILYARKDELEAILKSQLKSTDELSLAGVRYRMFNTESIHYPLESTLSSLADATEIGREELARKVSAIDKKALDAFLKDIEKTLDRPRVTLLKAELKASANISRSPRFWAKEISG